MKRMNRTKTFETGLGKINIPREVDIAQVAISGTERKVRFVVTRDGGDELGHIDVTQRPDGVATDAFLRSIDAVLDPPRGLLLKEISDELSRCIGETLAALRARGGPP